MRDSEVNSVLRPDISLGHIEDHRMGMKLRCGVAFDWTCSIVLESSGDELAGGLRRTHIADPRLRVPL